MALICSVGIDIGYRLPLDWRMSTISDLNHTTCFQYNPFLYLFVNFHCSLILCSDECKILGSCVRKQSVKNRSNSTRDQDKAQRLFTMTPYTLKSFCLHHTYRFETRTHPPYSLFESYYSSPTPNDCMRMSRQLLNDLVQRYVHYCATTDIYKKRISMRTWF